MRKRRQRRNSVRIIGMETRLRLAVHRSNTSTYAQLIDDSRGNTVASVSSREIKTDKKSKSEIARMTGELLAKRASEKGIKKVVFDRRGYRYHGRVRAFAEGARNGGLTF